LIFMRDLLQIISLESSGLSVIELLALSSIILVGSIIRGYAGFGFSAIVVAGASLFLSTREVVPLVLFLEVVASLQMAAQVRRHVSWKIVLSIMAGSVLFIPVGQYVLLWVAVEPMRVIAAVLLLISVTLVAAGKSLPVRNEPGGWFLIGTLSGFMNGLLAMGGIWIMIFLLNSGIKVVTLRASLVALFFITDCYAILAGSSQGLVTSPILVRFVWVLPSLFLGVWIGSRKFEASRPDVYKKVVLLILATLAVLLLLKALYTTVL
jgi:uncharacterized membrane protein YfcA